MTPAIPENRPPALRVMGRLGLEPDPWQTLVLESSHRRLLLNCARQAGKSTTVAILGLTEALFVPGTQVLLLSRSHRQSTELFRLLRNYHLRLRAPLLARRTVHELGLGNGSRIVCLPCREDTIRGYAGISLLVIDEAARVPDDLYRAVRPMLATSGGRLIGGDARGGAQPRPGRPALPDCDPGCPPPGPPAPARRGSGDRGRHASAVREAAAQCGLE